MDENCYIEPIHQSAVSATALQNADSTFLYISGMGCENCATRVRNSLLKVEGVFGVDVYLNMSMAEVRYDRQRVSAKTLAEAVSKAGNDGRHEYRVDLVVEE